MPLPQEFNPYIPQEELTKALAQYKQIPHQFSDEDVKTLKDHASYYNVPFAEDEERNQGRIGGLLSQIGKGFTEGFTTFDVFKGKPRDEYEAIARNIGHLAGFVGFIPSAPFKLLGLKTLAQAAKKVKGRSAPMIAAKYATDKASKIVGPALKNAATARAGATGTAAEFLTKPLVKDIAEGAFHLGVASSVSSWTHGVDEMMKSFIGGAQTGAVFRGIGNTIKTDSDTANKVLRGLSASMYQGMHATMAGATTPEQIYEYLLGAYFGWKEMPYHQRAAGKHLGEMVKAKQTDPELVKGWEDLDLKTQNFAKEQATKTYGTSEENLAIGYKVAKDLGINVEKQQEYAENYAKEVSDRVRMSQGAASPEDTSPLAEKVNKERRRETEENTSNTSEQDNLDVGSELVEIPSFTYQTENFVRRSLRDVWEPTEIKLQSRKIAEISGDIEEQWKGMLNQAFLTNRNPSEDMVNYINSKYGRTLNPEEAAFWRSLGNRKLKTKKVPLLTWDNGSIKRVEDVPEGEGTVPTNLAGNKKLLFEEPKIIDRVYQELTQDPQAQAYSVLDHAVFKTNQGQKEYNLNDVKKHFVRELKKDPLNRELAESGKWEDRASFWQKVDAAEARFHAENMLSMDARGEYYFSGKGDAARQYYVKYHPNSGNSKEAVGKNLKVLKSLFEGHGINWDVNYEQSKRNFVKEFGAHDKIGLEGKFGEIYDKSFISNIMYEASMNGFQINRAGLNKVLDVGFINDAKNFNKRAQIWFTTGISSNPEYIRGYLAKSKMPLDAEDNYNVKLVEDFKEVLYSDGAIVGHPDVIDAMNVDYGLPTAGGSVKSFIVSPNSKYGAMLGKYMIHSAPDNLRLWMEKNNVHMIVPRSAAKQIGLRGQLRTGADGKQFRSLGRMVWKNGGITMEGTATENQSYKVHSFDFKGVFSEKNDRHTMDDVSLPKQMQSNLTPYTYSSMQVPRGPERDALVAKNREAIDDMYENLSSRSFEGDAELNRKADLLAANPEKNSYLLMELEKNFEKIGVPTIIKAMKQPGNEQFANMAYNKMQRSNDEFVRSLVEEGEMTYDEADLFRSEVAEQLKVHEKLMQHSPDSLAGIFHKFGRDYRINSTRNYVVKRLTRPKVGNSFSSRMRPYDISLQNRGVAEGPTKILRTKKGENFFFLDESFKDYEIYSTVWNGKAKLGDVWATYLQGGYGVNQAKVKEVLRTALTRVPMDSMSGSHILDFGGFTGVRGYGVLLHPKTMDALGGADLDGDKAFGFFGSERYGFKKSWKDLYHAQKNEGEGIRSDELKAKYRENFVTGMDATVEEFTNPFYQYSPHTRKRISEAAYTGRTSLGPTVVNRATLNAAWSAVRGTKDGFFDYETSMQGLTTTSRGYTFSRYPIKGQEHYEVSTHGDKRFSALVARMPDGRTIETHYQNDVKKKLGKVVGKGKYDPNIPIEEYYKAYKALWRTWAKNNPTLIEELSNKAKDKVLTDKFAKGPVSQARVLSEILNERTGTELSKGPVKKIPMQPDNVRKIISGKKTTTLRAKKLDDGVYEIGNERFKITNRGLLNIEQAGGRAAIEQSEAFGATGPKFQGTKDFLAGKRKLYVYDIVPVGKTEAGLPTYQAEGAIKVRMIPLIDDANMKLFREKARAAISFASDPMDEGGLKNRATFFDELSQHLFRWEVFDPRTGEIIEDLTRSYNDPKSPNFNKNRRMGIVKIMSDINSKLYGKNVIEGRRWSFFEIQDALEGGNAVHPNGRNNMLSKLAESLHGVDYSDGVFNRVNFKALSEMYETHEKGLNSFRWLRNLLGRKHMFVPMGKFTDFINEFNIHTIEGMQNATNKRHPNWDRTHKLLTEKYTSGSRKGQYKWGIMNRNRYMERNIEKPEYKRYVLNHIKKQAEDFVVNDVSDIASMNLLRKYGDSIGESPVLEHIVAEVENIKRQSYLMARKKSNMRNIEDLSLNPEEKKLLREIRGELQLDELPVEQLKSQAEIDRHITKFKNEKNLTPQEKEFMDALLLSSVNRGYHDLISKAESIIGGKQMSKLFQQQFDSMVKNKDNTTVARIGFASSAVDPKVMADYMQEYKSLWNKASAISPKEKARVMGEAEVEGDRIILDERGNKVEGSTLETPEQDKLTQQYLDEAKPFEGLHNGTLKGEAQNIYFNVKSHLEHYNNKIGRDLNGVVRDVVGKDLNSMNLEDWRNIDRYFEQIKTGTWYQRMFDKVTQKSPEIKKRYYHMFPEAINRDMMRYELELMEVRRPYMDKEGNEKIGPALKPTGVVDMLQRYVYSAQENAINIGQEKKAELKEALRPYVDSIPEGRALYRMAVRIREAKHLGSKQFDYKKYLREESEKLNWDTLKEKEFGILVGDKRIQMTGRQVVENINDIISKQNAKVYKWLSGDKEKVDYYLNIDDGTHEGLVRMKNTFLEDLKTAARENRPMDIELGIDGLNRIAKRILISQVPAEGRREAQAALRKNLEIDTTNDLGAEGYFPHVNFDRGSARKRLLESIERTLDEKGVDPAERDKKVQGLIHHYKQMTGDWVTKDEMGDRWDEIGDHLAGIATKKGASKNYIQWYKSKMRVGNQYKRSTEPIPGWDIDPEAYDFYMKNVVDTFYRITSQIASRSLINDWSADFYHRAGKDKGLTNSWRQFLRLYVQDSMGYPSQIPESVLNDPKMKLKGTPYAWMADSNVLDRVNKIAAKLGVRQRKDLPGELKGFGYKDLSAWTNLEAKYQLATLLAHPKSSIANLYGGTSMTVISTGWENFRNARKIDYLKNTVNSKWTRMQDVEDWVTSHGVIEEFLRYEADINPQVKGEKWGRFFDDAMAKIKKDPNMSDATLRELSKKHGLTDKAFQVAASFMRVPERILRRDSFMAHYLQAKERFGGAITDFNDPFLIEMAKKGVKSTQFLYSAPFRPAFARTALGKVMTRFQLWAWNSVRFRNQVLREAEVRGWKQGTPEFKRFQRLATHDLFTYGMAGIFMYSLFENALPAPWNWFQDTADLLFGDDKERERAFFGAYPYPLQPLQLITPPAARLLPPMFKGMVTGDYEKLANYYVWTMFPFGRLAKDVVGPGGVLENPVYGVSKLTGIPYVQFAKQLKEGLKAGEEEEDA